MIATGRHGDEPAATITGRHLAAVAALIDQANDQRRYSGKAPLPTLAEIAQSIQSCSFERSVVAISHTDGSRWVPTEEVSRVLRLSPRGVQLRASRGTLESRKIGRRLYFPAELLEQADTASRPPRAKKSSRTPPPADTAHEEPAAPAPRRPRTFTFTPRS
jgi:hypothetical protein